MEGGSGKRWRALAGGVGGFSVLGSQCCNVHLSNLVDFLSASRGLGCIGDCRKRQPLDEAEAGCFKLGDCASAALKFTFVSELSATIRDDLDNRYSTFFLLSLLFGASLLSTCIYCRRTYISSYHSHRL